MTGLLLLLGSAQADRFIPDEYGSLGEAVNAAGPGETIWIDPTALNADGETYDAALDSSVIISTDLSIQGTQAETAMPSVYVFGAELTLIDVVPVATGQYVPLAHTGDLVEVTVGVRGGALIGERVTLDRGQGSTAIYGFESDFTFTDLSVTGMEEAPGLLMESEGGAASLTINGLTATQNLDGVIGVRGLASDAAITVTLNDVVAIENSANRGALLWGQGVGEVRLNSLEAWGNAATTEGGLVYLDGYSALRGGGWFVSGRRSAQRSEVAVSGSAAVLALFDEDEDATLELQDVALDGVEVSSSAAAGAFLIEDTQSRFISLTAADLNAPVAALVRAERGQLSIQGLAVSDFSLGGDGALIELIDVSLSESAGYTLRGCAVCAGSAAGEGAMLLHAQRSEALVSHCVVHGLTQSAGSLLRGVSAELTLQHNTFTDNPGSAVLSLSESQATLINNILAAGPVGVTLEGNANVAGGAANLWWGITGDLVSGDADLPSEEARYGDPVFWEGFSAGDCATKPYLAFGSDAIDHGALIDGDDLDGSLPDIGAYGGAHGVLPPDEDGDGYRVGADCDDSDAAVNPGAAEVPGDGVDNDCQGGDLSADDTGVVVDDSGGVDDSGDSGVGEPRASRIGLSGGCAHAGARAGAVWALALLLACTRSGRRSAAPQG